MSGPIPSLAYLNVEGKSIDNMSVMQSMFGGESEYATVCEEAFGAENTILPPIGILVMIIGAAISIILGLIGVIKGKIGIVLLCPCLVALVGAVLLVIGFIVAIGVPVSDVFASSGVLAALISCVLMFVFGLVAALGGNKNKTKKA